MYINKTYKYKYNGVVYVGEELPEGSKIMETMDILFAGEGKILRNKINGIETQSVWLKIGESQEDWEEIDEPKEEQNDTGLPT